MPDKEQIERASEIQEAIDAHSAKKFPSRSLLKLIKIAGTQQWKTSALS